jgi:transposase
MSTTASGTTSGPVSFHMIEAVATRLEGAPVASRRWSDEFKERAVVEATKPGANLSAVARNFGISPALLFKWRRKAHEKSSGAKLLDNASIPTSSVPEFGVVEIVIGDVVVRAGAGFDEMQLQRVIRAVRSA